MTRTDPASEPIQVWRTLSFTAAPTGWRLVYLDPPLPAGCFSAPLPGWVTQEACTLDPVDDVMTRHPVSETRVVAASVDVDGLIEEADASSNFWMVLPPGADLPTPGGAQQESADRRQRRARQGL
uniref:hypothetical protein n=1 Tax=Streptosporangium sp. CA-235898 TaxID=3240073 RepID=UPI003F492C1C